MNLQSEIQQNHLEWSQSLGKLWLSVVPLNKEKELLHYNSSSEWVQSSTSAVEYEKGARVVHHHHGQRQEWKGCNAT